MLTRNTASPGSDSANCARWRWAPALVVFYCISHIKFSKYSARIVGLLIVICLSHFSFPALAYNCTMSATNIAFGNVDVTTGGAVDSTATLTLSCSGAPSNKTVRMCVDIDGGSASDATSRLMNGPGAPQLRYQLYSDAARTTVWGSWSASLYGGGFTWDFFSPSSSWSTQTTVYGRVLSSQQTITAGAYTSALGLFFTYSDKNNNACPDPGKGNSSTTFSASATVTSNCAVSATNLNFGSIGLLSANLDASSTVTAACTNGAPYNVGLNAGAGTGATVAARKMTNGANTVTYSLYTNASRTTVWGNTVGTNTVGGTGSGSNQNLTVFGRMPPQTTPAPATYTDTIIVTVTY